MSTRGMSGAGLLVVGTLCLGLLATLGTACALVLRGMDVPSQLETIVGGLLVGVPALLARTYADREPVEVVQVADPGWVDDAGEVELLYVVLVVLLLFILLAVVGVI